MPYIIDSLPAILAYPASVIVITVSSCILNIAYSHFSLVRRIKIVPVISDLLVSHPCLSGRGIQVIPSTDIPNLYRLPALQHLSIGIQIIGLPVPCSICKLQEALINRIILFFIKIVSVISDDQPALCLRPEEAARVKIIPFSGNGLPALQNRRPIIDKGAFRRSIGHMNGHPISHICLCLKLCAIYRIKIPPFIVQLLPAVLKHSAVIQVIGMLPNPLLTLQHLSQIRSAFPEVIDSRADFQESCLHGSFRVKVIPLTADILPAFEHHTTSVEVICGITIFHKSGTHFSIRTEEIVGISNLRPLSLHHAVSIKIVTASADILPTGHRLTAVIEIIGIPIQHHPPGSRCAVCIEIIPRLPHLEEPGPHNIGCRIKIIPKATDGLPPLSGCCSVYKIEGLEFSALVGRGKVISAYGRFFILLPAAPLKVIPLIFNLLPACQQNARCVGIVYRSFLSLFANPAIPQNAVIPQIVDIDTDGIQSLLITCLKHSCLGFEVIPLPVNRLPALYQTCIVPEIISLFSLFAIC